MLKRGRRRVGERGFTLVEVSVVVVIVAVLAAIGFVVFTRHKREARMAEAKQIVAAIRLEQETFKTEKGHYCDISNDVTSYYPAATPGPFATEWGGACSNCKDAATGWKRLAVRPAGPVMYGYATIAGVGGTFGAAAPEPLRTTTIEPTEPFYIIQAEGDVDGDGVKAKVLGFSASNQLILENEGE